MTKHYIVFKDDVVDNLTSTSTTSPLSANQGKALNNSISAITPHVSGSVLYFGA